VLKARMNADLHMAEDLKNTGKGNLFVIFGEPDISLLPGNEKADDGTVRVKVNGVDVFKPQTGEVVSDGADGIACWFIDTDYNEESFFVRHAYFLGANDPYSALKTTLKAEIDHEAWATLNSDTSRPFEKPKSGRIADRGERSTYQSHLGRCRTRSCRDEGDRSSLCRRVLRRIIIWTLTASIRAVQCPSWFWCSPVCWR
jgi:hypothetical protein